MSEQIEFQEEELNKESFDRMKSSSNFSALVSKIVGKLMTNKILQRTLGFFLVYIIVIGIFYTFTRLNNFLFIMGLLITVFLLSKYEKNIKIFIRQLTDKLKFNGQKKSN